MMPIIPTPTPVDDPTSDMTTSSQQMVADANTPKPAATQVDPAVKKRNTLIKAQIDACKAYRRKLITNWVISIDYRRGKPFASQSDEDQIAVNLDWSLTKAKIAGLFSQVPQVRVNHSPQTLDAPWVHTFEQLLNDTLVTAGIEAAMDEVLPDCINAAGFGATLVAYEAITEDVEVPTIDLSTLPPELAAEAQASKTINGAPIPMQTIPRVVDKRYVIQRISPSDLIWSIKFTNSDFDSSPLIGRSGKVSWAEAVQRFKLTEEDKSKVCGEDKPILDALTQDTDKDSHSIDDTVTFDEVYYKEFQYIPEAKSYSTIHHVVFVNGKDDPVIDEPWKGQKVDETTGAISGSKKYPIRVLTLTYITDETIPPSDSAIGRPQVDEINDGRGQMRKQRERSLPIRTMDVNRMDPTIAQGLMRGKWQAIIPVQGDGSRIITEIARASMPQENFAFDKIAKGDLNDSWSVGPNQTGSGQGVDTAGEAKIIESNFQTRQGRERAKTAAYIVGIAEVLGGLMCLYEDPSQFGEGFGPDVSDTLAVSILADATVLVDANQRLQRLNNFINTYAKSGWVNLEPVLKEIATLSGLDPNTVIQAPQPKPPVEPNISLRLTGVEDMMNPLTLAFLLKSGQAPEAQLIEQAKTLIQQAVTPPAGMQLAGGPGTAGGMPIGMMPDGTPDPNAPPQPPNGGPPGAPLPPPQPGPPPGAPLPHPPPPAVGDAHPKLTIMPTIDKRSDPPKVGG